MRICKVLIVENDDHVRDLLANVFEDEGYLFSLVKTGGEMQEKLEEGDFDIAVIDVTQPGHEDGFVLGQIARDHGCGPILVTGDHRYLERLQACDGHFLLKPFRIQQLIEVIEKVLAETSAQCARRNSKDGPSFPTGVN